MFDIAVILVNFNSSQYTIEAINSIVENTTRTIKYQIIVVDNGSRYEDYQKLESQLQNKKNLTLIRSKINTGFGTGNMIGVNRANAKYYALVNNDTVINNDCLSILQNYLQNNSNVALCAPQGFDENNEVLKSFDHFLTLKRELFGRKIFEKINSKKYPKRDKVYRTPVKVQAIPGSFMFVDAKQFDLVGGFDTNIFLYYEETDLAFRLSKLKTKNECYLVPKAQYVHFKGKSTSKNFSIKKEIKISLLYVLKKNSYLSYLFLRCYLIVQYFFKSLFKPKYFSLVTLFLKGAPLSSSLKQSQIIQNK